MTIYTTDPTDGKPVILLEAPLSNGSVYHRSLSNATYLNLSFTLPQRINLHKGCYVLYRPDDTPNDGDDLTGSDTTRFKYELMTNSYPEYHKESGGWQYNIKFESAQSHMKYYNVFYRGQGYDEVAFVHNTTLGDYADLLASSMDRANLGFTWKGKVEFPISMPADEQELKRKVIKAMTFKGDKVWDAASHIAEAFGVEWWTEENGSQIDICFGKKELGTEVEIREGEIVNRLPTRKGDDSNYGTRFYVFGSTRNLDQDYQQHYQERYPSTTNS